VATCVAPPHASKNLQGTIIQGGHARLLENGARNSETTQFSTSVLVASTYSRPRRLGASPTFQPRPFDQLESLVYSDKKPGDASTRQLIVKSFHIPLKLYPTPAPLLPLTPGSYRMGHSRTGSTSTLIMSPVPESAPTLPHLHTTAFSPCALSSSRPSRL